MDAKKFESIVDSSKLLAACGKVDPVKECCQQVCQSAILDAARKIAMDGMINMPENSTRIDDCKSIVFRWLASKLDPSSANGILRALSNCKVNKGELGKLTVCVSLKIQHDTQRGMHFDCCVHNVP